MSPTRDPLNASAGSPLASGGAAAEDARLFVSSRADTGAESSFGRRDEAEALFDGPIDSLKLTIEPSKLHESSILRESSGGRRTFLEARVERGSDLSVPLDGVRTVMIVLCKG